MSRRSTAAIITFSALSFVTSAATLVVMAIGAKKIHNEIAEAKIKIEEVKTKTNNTVNRLKSAIQDLDI